MRQLNSRRVNREVSVVRRFCQNIHGSDYIAGDIHGEYGLLKRKLMHLGFEPHSDRLFCVGDLVDRGPDSRAVLDCLGEAWFFSVLGNHEEMILRAADEWMPDWFLLNGGEWWLNSDSETRQRIIEQLRNLPLLIEIDTGDGRIGIAHADVPRRLPWQMLVDRLGSGDEDARECLLWSRRRVLYKDTFPVPGIDRVYCGHTPVASPTRVGNVLFIDTGACYGGDLTILPAWTEAS